MIRSFLPSPVRLALLLASASLLSAQTPATVPADGAPHAFVQLKTGDVAPNFTVTGPKGETIALSDFKGHVLVVDVSATWCGPCQAAMPNNDRVYRKYADQGVVLLGVTTDDSRANYDSWVKRNADKYKFTMTFDPAGHDGWKTSVFNTDYHITGFPSMFVIGRDGKIVEMVSGGGPGDDYRLEYALARAGVKVDLASLPPEPKRDPNGPKFIPAFTKTPAMKKSIGMVGMGGASSSHFIPEKFGSVESGGVVPDFIVTGVDGQPVKLSSFHGKPVLVHFVTSNGPQSWFTDVLKAYPAQNYAVLVVFSATERADFNAWVAKNPQPGYTVAWDPAGKAWAENVPNINFGVGMYPATVVVNADGTLVSGAIGMGGHVGLMTKAMLARAKAIQLTADDQAAVTKASTVTMPSAVIRPHPGGPVEAPKEHTLRPGAVAPDFVSQTLAGKDVKLSDYKDKIIILDFWATWCGPCMASMPHTQEMAAKYKDQGVVVIGSCTSDARDKFEEWVKKNQEKYPDILFTCDPHDRGSKTFDERASSKLYHVVGIPTQFVIGRDGKIAGTLVGYDKGDARAEAVLAHLGVKVDADTVSAGEAGLKRDAEDEIKQAEAAKDAIDHPKPGFRESYGVLKAGSVVPDFDVIAADGKPAKFSDYAKGKVVVLDFWATWCGPCQQAMPHYEEIHHKYGKDVVVLGLCCFDTHEAYEKWTKTNQDKYTFTTVFDPVGKPDPKEKNSFTKTIMWRISGGVMSPLPTTLVIGRDGKFVGCYSGYGPAAADTLANLLMIAGVELASADKPKIFFPAGSAAKLEPKPEAKVAMIKVGAPAPDFTTTDVDGHPVKISDYKGKVVVLDFWATWCGPCMASLPHTEAVAAKYKDQGVVVLGSCTSDSRKNFEGWVKKNQATYPDVVFSHDAAERGAGRASHHLYGVNGIPTQFIIGRDGNIAAINIGYMKGEVLLEGALAKAGVNVDPALVAQAAADLKKRNEN